MKDNFSAQAKLYSIYRPVYPDSLYEYLFDNIENTENAWDCATGNGQVARRLSEKFEKVYATDISQSQIDNAEKKDNILYLISPAEETSFKEDLFDLITVGQALHWFDFEKFYSEVKRVGKKGSSIAVWGYSLLKISEKIDEIILKNYTDLLGSYWDQERKLVDQEYQSIPFPFEDIKEKRFTMDYQWSLNDFEGYLNTWSAVQHFIKKNNYNPVPQIIDELKPFWSENEIKNIYFPVFFKMGKIK